MKDNSTPFRISKISKIIFIVSIFVSVYWWIGQITDVYHYKVVGAIYEILWLPVLLLLFGLPVISFVLLLQEKFNFRSLYLYTILILAATITAMFTGI